MITLRSFSVRLAAAALATASFINFAHAQSASPSQAERVSWPGVSCTGQPIICNKMDNLGHLFAKPDQTKIVLISHGSQGIDSRMFDYVDALQKEGFAALVIDHWKPRGIDVTHNDYAAAEIKGGSGLNMAFDSALAAHWLRTSRGFEKIGSIGESQGGGSAMLLNKKPINAIIKRNAERLYGKEFRLKPLDAIVGMYGYCGTRTVSQDVFYQTPFLFITGEKDDQTPSKLCEQYTTWMNDNGGNAKTVVLPGVGHSFDAPYAKRYVQGEQYAACELLVEDTTVKNVQTGDSLPNSQVNIRSLMNKCKSRGFTSGHSGNRFVAVPTWTAFFQQHLN